MNVSKIVLRMFSRQWVITTVLVLSGAAVCFRLGIWQLDRLEQRRAFNAQVESMRAMELLDMNRELPDSLESMEWRAVSVRGEFDFDNQVVLRNQYQGGQYGYHLITPLRFDGRAVLVDRGWIPAEGNIAPQDWRKYDEAGPVTLRGQIRLGRGKPAFGGVEEAAFNPGQTRRTAWNNLDVAGISGQIPYAILPVYIQPNASEGDVQPPISSQPELELTEGPHFGYALQWFSFAAILLLGYPFYLRKQV